LINVERIGSQRYKDGEELDFSVSYLLTKQLSGKVEYADYRAGDPPTGKRDITKLRFTLVYTL
jgi:hypothetical protein